MPPSARPTVVDPSGNNGYTGNEIYLLWCNATKANRSQCNQRVVPNLDPAFAPVCKRHIKLRLPQGICKGKNETGELCGQRFLQKAGEYPLCSLHKDQYTSMPSYLLKLPVELRMEILRHLAPRSYSDRAPKRREIRKQYRSIMKVHPTISREATTIFYGDTPFELIVEHDGVRLCGFLWRPTFLTRNIQDLIDAFSLVPVRHMREFNVVVKVKSRSLAQHWRDATEEGTISDRCRELCHVVTDFLASFPKIRRLEVSFNFSDTYEPVQAAIVVPYILSPFMRLRRIRQPILHALLIGWGQTEVGSIRETTNVAVGKPNETKKRVIDMDYQKLQADFAKILQRDEPPLSKPPSWIQYEALLNALGGMGCLLDIRHFQGLALLKIHRTACFARDMNDSSSLTSLCNTLLDTFQVQRNFENIRWKRFKSAVDECTSSAPPGSSFKLRFREIVTEQRPEIQVTPLAYDSVVDVDGEVENYWIMSDGMALLKYHKDFAHLHERGFRVAPCTVGIALDLAKRLGRRPISIGMRLDTNDRGVVCVDDGIRYLVEFPTLVPSKVGVTPEV